MRAQPVQNFLCRMAIAVVFPAGYQDKIRIDQLQKVFRACKSASVMAGEKDRIVPFLMGKEVVAAVFSDKGHFPFFLQILGSIL